MTTQYFSIVNRTTGIMIDGVSNYTDHTDRPLTADYMYVPLSEFLTHLLIGDGEALGEENHPVDFTTSHYDFSTSEWVINYLEVEVQDPVENAVAKQQEMIAEAQRKLNIPDLSSSARGKLTTYLSELNSLVITKQTARDIQWPVLPL